MRNMTAPMRLALNMPVHLGPKMYVQSYYKVKRVLDAAPCGAAVIGLPVFVSTSLLNLVKEAAGCGNTVAITAMGASKYLSMSIEGQDKVECTGEFYGLRLSSLLMAISLTYGMISACIMTLVGMTADHTQYRRTVGRIYGMNILVLTMFQIFISPTTWVVISVSQVVLELS